MDDNKLHALKQYQLGNNAKKALFFFENWLRDRRIRLNRDLMNSKEEKDIMAIWNKLKVLDEFESDVNTAIQSGDLAMDELDDEDYD